MQTVTPSEDALLARDPDGLDDHERRPESPEYIEGVVSCSLTSKFISMLTKPCLQDYEIRFPSSNNDHTMNVASRNMDDSNWSVDAASSVGESRNASRWIKVNVGFPQIDVEFSSPFLTVDSIAQSSPCPAACVQCAVGERAAPCPE